jgi:hypothetical protein
MPIFCSFGTFFRFWYHVGTSKNLATLVSRNESLDPAMTQDSAFLRLKLGMIGSVTRWSQVSPFVRKFFPN